MIYILQEIWLCCFMAIELYLGVFSNFSLSLSCNHYIIPLTYCNVDVIEKYSSQNFWVVCQNIIMLGILLDVYYNDLCRHPDSFLCKMYITMIYASTQIVYCTWAYNLIGILWIMLCAWFKHPKWKKWSTVKV